MWLIKTIAWAFTIFLILIFIIGLSSKPQSKNKSQNINKENTTPESLKTACNSVSTLAESIMKERQKGTPITELIKRSNKLFSEKDKANVETLIIEAYKTPLFNSDKYSNDAISNFRDNAYLACIGKY